MPESLGVKKVLVTGASGKIGRSLIPALLGAGYSVRATQNRTPVECEGVEVVTGSVSDWEFVRSAVAGGGGVDAVCHLATTKEDRNFIEVSVRGTFNLLDAAKEAGGVKQFILAGGDAALGIFFYENPEPLTEESPLRAYPGYYAFSKVLEEVMTGQYAIQYGLGVTVMRCSWIMEGDDLLSHMTLAPPDFGGPAWKELVITPEQRAFFDEGRDGAGVLRHPDGSAYVRHVVAIEDVVGSMMAALDSPAAVGETFNVAAPEAFRYDALAGYISSRLDVPAVDFECDAGRDFRIDVSKIGRVLGREPQWTAERMIDAGIEFRRSGSERAAAGYSG